MTYTLVNASALCADLIRRPDPRSTALPLLLGLGATEGFLTELAQLHPAHLASEGAQRVALLASSLNRAQRLHRASSMAGSADQAGMQSPSDLPLLGEPTSLEHLIFHEILGPGSASDRVPQPVRDLAADLLTDAVVHSWNGGLGGDGGSLSVTVMGAALRHPIDLAAAGISRSVGAQLAALPAGGAQHERWQLAANRSNDPVRWSRAMHEATWAAHMTGRIRQAALAQLLALQRVVGAGLGELRVDLSCWNAISGVVQATVVHDVLEQEAASILLDPFRDLLGAGGGR